VFENVYISTKEDKFDFEAPLIYDKEKLSSPMVALASIFQTLKADFFLLSVDMPLLTLESIERLVSLYKKQPKSGVYLFESCNGLEPTAAIYSYKCYGTLLKQIEEGRHSLQEFIRLQSYTAVKLESQEAFWNLNHKSEYLKAIEIFSKHSASKRSSEV
jgi:molybdopterin-guanine dinucleotide biosynthesis protein A